MPRYCYQKRILASFKSQPGTRLTTMQLMELSGLPRRTINSALAMLVKHGLIQRYGQGRAVRYQLVF
jgi:DNA-binding GntR family transcriptional regulator